MNLRMKQSNFWASCPQRKCVFGIKKYVFLFLLLVVVRATHAQSNKDTVLQHLGFSLAQPDGMTDSTNPYGYGTVNFNPFHELYDAYYMHDFGMDAEGWGFTIYDPKKSASPLVEETIMRWQNIVASHDDWADGAYRRVWAGDFTGSGKKDCIVEVFMTRSTTGHTLTQAGTLTLSLTDAKTGTRLALTSLGPLNFSNNSNGGIYPSEIGSFLSAAVGDFNGDGKDEVAVFVPISNMGSSDNLIGIYSYTPSGNPSTSFQWKHTIDLPLYGYPVNNNLHNYLSVQMVTSDLNQDGFDDLVVMASFHDNSTIISNNAANSASRMFIYQADGDTMKLVANRTLQFKDSIGPAYNLRNAAASIGDINGDGVKDIVVAGNYSPANSWDLVGEYLSLDDNFLPGVAMAWFNGNGNSGKGAITSGVYVDAFDVLENISGYNAYFNYAVTTTNDFTKSPVSLVTFKANGTGEAASVFLDGCVYKYKQSDNIFHPVDSANIAIAEASPSYMSWKMNYHHENRWFAQAVAGNFTKDPNGKESVIYAHGHGSMMDQFIFDIGSITKNYIDESNETWTSLSTRKTYAESEHNVSVATVDIDDDGMLVRYKNKKDYYFTDPKIVAVLQAAPYFSELEALDGGYAGNGATSISRSTGGGTSTNQSVSLSAGVVVGYENKVSLFGISEVLGIEVETKVVGSMGYQYQSSSERTATVSVNSPSDADRVIVTMIPYTRYYYDLWMPEAKLVSSTEYAAWKTRLTNLENQLQALSMNDTEYPALAKEYYEVSKKIENIDSLLLQGYIYGQTIPAYWDTCVINIPSSPRTMTITVDEYDAMAHAYGLDPIRGTALLTTTQTGDPSSYRSNPLPNADLPTQDWQTVSVSGLSTRTLEVSNTESTSHGLTWGLSTELSFAMSAGGFKAGISAGIDYEGGYAWSETSGNTFSGTVSDLPFGASGYRFDWRFMIHREELNNEPCMVLEYLTKNVLRADSIDDDGISNYELQNTNYVIYPNPTAGKLSVVSSQLSESGGEIEIYDVVGQVVGTYRIHPENTETVIDISHLSAGLYFLKIDNNVIKVVKE